MIHKIAKQMARYIGKSTAATRNETAKICYGLEIILSMVIKACLLLLTSYFLGVLFPMLIVLLTASGFRTLTGGAHCSTFCRCLCAGLLVFNGLGYLTRVIASSFNTTTASPIISIIAILGLIITYKYAPADAVIKPGKNHHRKKIIKEVSLALIIVWFSTMILIVSPMTFNSYWKEIMIGSALGFTWQCFTVTPLGFKLFQYSDKFCNIVISKGGESCEI